MPFTVVFAGKLSDVKNNPFKIESEFGLPLVVSIDDLTEEIENLERELDLCRNANPTLTSG